MKKWIFLLLLGIAFAPVYAQRPPGIDSFFPIDAGHSYIEFSVRYMGYAKVKGRFATFDGMVFFDKDDPSKTSVTLVITAPSIDTDLDFRDNDLKSPNWLDATTFPMLMFRSKKTVASGPGLSVTGDLTIHGVTKEVVLKLEKPSGVLKDVRKDDQVIFTGTADINRIDFGVEGKNWSAVKEGIAAVENEVHIEFSILGKQIKKDNFTNWVSNVQQPPGKLYQIVKTQGAAAAVTEFEKMRKENAVQQFAMSTVGYMLQMEGNLKEALIVLEANKAAFPELAAMERDLGQAYWRSGDHARAKEALGRCLQKDPNDARGQELMRHLGN